MPTRRVITASCLCLLAAACSSKPREIVEGPAYPALTQKSTLDVQVIRDGTQATLTNTSTRTFTNARLWANQWYSLALPSLKPGETVTLHLADFKDRYGQPFRAGGFWAPDNPEKLVLMQVEEGETLTGLVVVGKIE